MRYVNLCILLSFCLVLTSCSGQEVVNGGCENRVSYDLVDTNSDIDTSALFRPADSLELAEILAEWTAFTPLVGTLETVHTETFGQDRQLMTVAHSAEGLRHYGALITPSAYDPDQQYPVFVSLAGLNQNDPTNYPFGWTALENFYRELEDHFIIIPGFRGQNLTFEGRSYCSDGYFGDAYDGATDDALRLLALTQQKYAIDPAKIRVSGFSRGGTVALLMAARDTTIQACISMSGPSDFHHADGYNRYGIQFRYQFLTERKPLTALRKKMLRCSPVEFISRYPNHVLIVHGRQDNIVPLWHAERVVAAFDGRKNVDHAYLNEGHGFNELRRMLIFLRSL